MSLTNSKRKLLASSLIKAAEYVFALLILGQFISRKLNVFAILLSVVMYILLVITAMVVMPEEEEE